MKTLFVVLFLYPIILFGQHSDSLLATFYNQTMLDYFPKGRNNDQKKFGCLLVETNFNANLLIKNCGKNKFKFFTSQIEKHSVLAKPFKRNNERRIYYLKHKSFGQDTLDITIGIGDLSKITKKRIWISFEDGGTMGYIPDGRFVFNKTTQTWTFYNYEEISIQRELESDKWLLEQKRLRELEQKKN